jgi:hypothetical protein
LKYKQNELHKRKNRCCPGRQFLCDPSYVIAVKYRLYWIFSLWPSKFRVRNEIPSLKAEDAIVWGGDRPVWNHSEMTINRWKLEKQCHFVHRKYHMMLSGIGFEYYHLSCVTALIWTKINWPATSIVELRNPPNFRRWTYSHHLPPLYVKFLHFVQSTIQRILKKLIFLSCHFIRIEKNVLENGSVPIRSLQYIISSFT